MEKLRQCLSQKIICYGEVASAFTVNLIDPVGTHRVSKVCAIEFSKVFLSCFGWDPPHRSPVGLAGAAES